MTVMPHIPVLLDEMLLALHPKEGDVLVDATFGAGGYSKAILEHAACHVIALDQDPEVLPYVNGLQEIYGSRLRFIAGNFADMESLLAKNLVTKVDGIVMDIGVSSMQLDTGERGFSFRFDAPLDMRMSKQGMSAADFLNHAEEKEIARVLKEYGEEPAARRIAKAVLAARAIKPIETTKEFADIVHGILGPKRKTDPATRSFQALRIHVNDELGALKRALVAAEKLLKPDGRLVVVCFHSLEDRIVKQFFKERSASNDNISRHAPVVQNMRRPSFSLLRPGKIHASESELLRNPRARSAILRRGVRTHFPAWGAT